MNNPLDIRAKANRIEHQAKALMVEADTASAERSAELMEQFDRMVAEADGLYERADKLEALEARRSAVEEAVEARRSTETREIAEEEEPAKRYADAFETYLRGNASADDLRILRANSVGTGSEGGYLVPTNLASTLITSKAHFGPMLNPSLVTIVNTDGTGAPMNWPTFNGTSMKATRINENTQASPESFTVGQKPLNVFKYKAGPFLIPTELQQDSVINVGDLVNGIIGEMFVRRVNEECTVGDGTGDINGFVSAATSALTAADDVTVTFDELSDLVYAGLDLAYHGNASFQFNQNTLGKLRKLKNSDGDYIWTAGDVKGGLPGTILGFRYDVNPAMAAMAAGSKSIAFGDFKYYHVRQIEGVTVKRLVERFADYDQVGYVSFARFGGNLMNTDAIKVITQAAS